MMVMYNATVISEHDRRRSGLPSTPAVMEHGNSSIEQSIAIAPNMTPT